MRAPFARELVRLLAAATLGALALTGCDAAEDEAFGPVVVGVGSTEEQQVLAALTVVALEDAGVATELAVDLGDTVGLRRETLRGEIDLYWDYSGAAWALGLAQHDPPADPEESVERVRQEDRDRGLVWLEASEANATLALFVRDDAAPPEQAPTLDWLAGEVSAGERPLCVDPDFRDRPGGLADLAAAHPMDLERVAVREADEDAAIEAVADGECFAGLATATSGAAYAEGLVPAADELGIFPAFVVAPVVREEALATRPELAEALEEVSASLDTATLARLNARAADAEGPEERQALAREELAAQE